MIPHFELSKIKRNLVNPRLVSLPPPPPPLTTGMAQAAAQSIPQERRQELPAFNKDVTIFIPVNMWPGNILPKEHHQLLALQKELLARGYKRQGVRRNPKDIQKEIDKIKESFTPGLPPLPKKQMLQYGMIAGVKNNPRSRTQPLDVPSNWSTVEWLTPFGINYLITGFSGFQSSQYIKLDPFARGNRHKIVNAKKRFFLQPKLSSFAERTRVMMLIKIRPVYKSSRTGEPVLLRNLSNAEAKPILEMQPEEILEDLFNMINQANENRRKRLENIDSPYADLSFFPRGIITMNGNTSTGYWWSDFDQYTELPNFSYRLEDWEAVSLPTTRNANHINFLEFARLWNKTT